MRESAETKVFSRFSACPHDGVFRRLISGNTEKTKRALCALCTQRPFLLSLISARKRALCHCPSENSMPSDEKLCVIGELIFTVRKSLIIAP